MFNPLLTNAWQLGLKPYVYEGPPCHYSLTFLSSQSHVSLATFILAMVLHPDIQRKARANVAAVITAGTLPSFDAEPSLPFISAIAFEVLRWRPATPFGTMQSEYLLVMVDQADTQVSLIILKLTIFTRDIVFLLEALF